jgi:hypothetical protein
MASIENLSINIAGDSNLELAPAKAQYTAAQRAALDMPSVMCYCIFSCSHAFLCATVAAHGLCISYLQNCPAATLAFQHSAARGWIVPAAFASSQHHPLMLLLLLLLPCLCVLLHTAAAPPYS